MTFSSTLMEPGRGSVHSTHEYVGVSSVETSLAPETTSLPELEDVIKNVGKGSMLAMHDTKVLGTQFSSSGCIRTYIYLRAPAE